MDGIIEAFDDYETIMDPDDETVVIAKCYKGDIWTRTSCYGWRKDDDAECKRDLSSTNEWTYGNCRFEYKPDGTLRSCRYCHYTKEACDACVDNDSCDTDSSTDCGTGSSCITTVTGGLDTGRHELEDGDCNNRKTKALIY